MKIRGSIKNVNASMAADQTITQKITIEFTDDEAIAQLRDMMQKPIIVTIEETQMSFGKKA